MAQIVFLSDAHLGSGSDSAERERQLCLFLDSIKDSCDKLFLLGDIFDFWFTYRHLVPRGHVRLLGKLAELTDSGIEVHFFIGNHDMWVFDYLSSELGIITHSEPEILTLNGRRCLIGHGDGLGHTDRWFDFVRFFFRSRFCQRLFKMLPSAFTFGIAHRWSDSNKRHHARRNMLRYLGDDREGIVIHCRQVLEKEPLDYCIFGHRHTPLIKPIAAPKSTNTATYLNTGDWLHNRNYAVLHPDGSLNLYDYPLL